MARAAARRALGGGGLIDFLLFSQLGASAILAIGFRLRLVLPPGNGGPSALGLPLPFPSPLWSPCFTNSGGKCSPGPAAA